MLHSDPTDVGQLGLVTLPHVTNRWQRVQSLDEEQGGDIRGVLSRNRGQGFS
jgi:hypothetical protein